MRCRSSDLGRPQCLRELGCHASLNPCPGREGETRDQDGCACCICASVSSNIGRMPTSLPHAVPSWLAPRFQLSCCTQLENDNNAQQELLWHRTWFGDWQCKFSFALPMFSPGQHIASGHGATWQPFPTATWNFTRDSASPTKNGTDQHFFAGSASNDWHLGLFKLAKAPSYKPSTRCFVSEHRDC